MVRLSVTLMCGNNSKFWKTMPTWERSLDRLVFASASPTPLTMILPCWMVSRPLTQRISVLLPEPEGPHTTTTSPLFTWVVQSVST